MVHLQEYMQQRQGDPSTTALPPNPLMLGLDPGSYVLKAVGSVKVPLLACLLYSHCISLLSLSQSPEGLAESRCISLPDCSAFHACLYCHLLIVLLQ